MKVIVWITLLVSLAGAAQGQNLKGKITDAEGEPLAGATVYVRETAQGSAADGEGRFQITLPEGNYTLDISCLGYEKKRLQVQVASGLPEVTVRLQPVVYRLREVIVSDKGEDPAYYVMRNAIARAPYHRNQVKGYTSEVYTKGTMKLDKMPKLLMLSQEVRKAVKPFMGKTFLLESVMEVAFQAPQTYERTVKAFSSTIPDEMDAENALNIITASIYDPSVMGVISPLAPGAFSYYRFTFEECYDEGGRTINRIRIDPRKENTSLFEGWIYIVEDDWSVSNFRLISRVMGISMDFRCVFNEVRHTVFMPTSYEIDLQVNVMGFKAVGKYFSSLKYLSVSADTVHTYEGMFQADSADSADSAGSAEPAAADPKREKRLNKLQTLLEKEELTTRDAYKIARLSEEAMQPARPDTVPSLQIIRSERQEKVTVDSLASQRDSLFWAAMRTVPLRQEEADGYREKESLKQIIAQNRAESDSSAAFNLGDKWLWGGSVQLGENVRLDYGGLMKVMPEYNFVDGFWIGQPLTFRIKGGQGRSLRIAPAAYYALARKAFIWEVKNQFRYAPMQNGELTLDFGSVSADFYRDGGAPRFENMLVSIVSASNYMKFYEKRYLRFQNRIDPATGLFFTVGGLYEKRSLPENHASYNLRKRDPEPNLPSLRGGIDMPAHASLSFHSELRYTPRYYFEVKDGRKQYVKTAWPTFSVRYEKGVQPGTQCGSSYDRLEVGIFQDIRLGLFDRIVYGASAGKFLSKKELWFPDYKHFKTIGWTIAENDWAGVYLLPDYYALSTNREWATGTLDYYSSYLLLKRLPFLQRFLFGEALHFRYLRTPDTGHYMEAGYSLGFGRNLRAGGFVSFDRGKYKAWGIRVTLPLNL
ncbi:MAG: DUF5686 and carboxypeptidase regulatory-like domain-containing protein [Culturomica sp.]|nr:DUF5686 and carboxypeptidase regulatory-like domain-containing protein [Culturomica sp.]